MKTHCQIGRHLYASSKTLIRYRPYEKPIFSISMTRKRTSFPLSRRNVVGS